MPNVMFSALPQPASIPPSPPTARHEHPVTPTGQLRQVGNTLASGLGVGARGALSALDLLAPGRIYRNVSGWLTSALALSALGNVGARPQALHGGNYMTEAHATWQEDIESPAERCITALGAQHWPAKSVAAHCVVQAVVELCDQDRACHSTVDRTLWQSRDALARQPTGRYVDSRAAGAAGAAQQQADTATAGDLQRARRHALHARFYASDVFVETMTRLQGVAEARTEEEDFSAPAAAYTWQALDQLLAEDPDMGGTKHVLRASAHAAHGEYQRIAEQMYLLQPEQFNNRAYRSLQAWIDLRYPKDPAQPMTEPQTRQTLKNLAHFLNERYPVVASTG